MRLNRFFIKKNLKIGNITVSDKNFINQARNVLRLKIGDELILCDGNLSEAVAEIINLNKEFAELKILETYKNGKEPENYVILYCPILKKENFELAVQKAVEVGVKEITPLITARTVKFGLNYERLNKIIKEAAEQSGRVILPLLREPVKFGEAVKQAKSANDLNLFSQIDQPSIVHKQADRLKCAQCKIGVFVGPEGGWTEEEMKNAQSNGFKLVGLGNTVLRAETAVIVASYLAVN